MTARLSPRPTENPLHAGLSLTSAPAGPMVARMLALMLAVLLAGCAGSAKRTVVVEDRSVARPTATASTAKAPGAEGGAATTAPSGGPAGDAVSNAGKPGYYTVKPGDTLVRIGLDHGQNWRDIARWNQIENPNLIEVGQVLRVRPEAVAGRPSPRPDRAAAAPSAPATPGVSPQSVPATGAGAPAPVAVPSTAAVEPAAGDPNWAWPASGPVVQGFDEQRNKGLDIAGKAGDPVLAAADGRVVYAGSALRGYGNLVILKHNGTFLSAYAHNQTLLVKEDQPVKRGQKIAEMGSTDAERVQLHFEIRRDGKPVDPARYLPAR